MNINRHRMIRRASVLASITAAAFATTSLAGISDITWNGHATPGTTTTWSNSENWSEGVVPSEGRSVIFGTGFNSGLSISIAGANPVSNFTIDTGSAFTLNPNSSSLATPLTFQMGALTRSAASSGTQTFACNIHQNFGGTWSVNGAGALAVSGVISGSTLIKSGAGTLILSGANTHTNTTISAGTVAITSDANLGASTGMLKINNAALHVTGSVGIDHKIELTNNVTIAVDSGTVYLQGGVTGNGTLIKTGAGRMRLFGTDLNTYTGNVVNMQGQILTNYSSLRGDVTNHGELQLSQSGTGTYANNISGAGSLLIGGGNITFSGANTFTGGTTINDSNVSVSTAANLGAASNVVTFNNDASVLQLTAVLAAANPLVFSAGVSGTIHNDSGSSTLSGAITGDGTMIKTGDGVVKVTNLRNGALAVNGGKVTVSANGGDDGASRIGTLAIAGKATPAATLDLTDNDLVLTNSTYASTRDLIRYARNGGAWDRPGLTSSAAASATPRNKTLAVLSGLQYLSIASNEAFDGFDVATSDVLVKYTYYGDANADGRVNFDDYAKIDSGFNSSGADWFNGDFNLDGRVNFDDYALIDAAYNSQNNSLPQALRYLGGEARDAAGMDSAALQMVVLHYEQFGEAYAHSFIASVPEPGSIALLAGMAIVGLWRRRA